MSKNIFQNTCKPEGAAGKLVVAMMNSGHKKVALWGLSFLSIEPTAHVLDIGCGGGANVERLLVRCPQGNVKGIDYSEVSVEASAKKNAFEIANGRCEILQGNVTQLPFADEAFQVVTAFETVYFWPDLSTSFAQVFRVLRSGGLFMICNESDGENTADEKWTKIINGMRIYSESELEHILLSVGFSKISIHRDRNKHWLCVIARK